MVCLTTVLTIERRLKEKLPGLMISLRCIARRVSRRKCLPAPRFEQLKAGMASGKPGIRRAAARWSSRSAAG